MYSHAMRRAAAVFLTASVAFTLSFAAAWASAAPGPGVTPTGASQGKQPPPVKIEVKVPPMSDQTIPGTPLQVTVRDSGSAGVFYNGIGQFSSDYGEGIFLWVNGQVWGPGSIPNGPNVNPFGPVSNVLTGSGTAQSPWRVTTTLSVGGTGLRVIRNIRYVNGNTWTRQDFEIDNTSGQGYILTFFHAADLKTGGDDSGYGYLVPAQGAIGGYTADRGFFQLFMPINPGSFYQEGPWSDIWAAIGNVSGPGPGFNNTYHPDTNEDNGAGLQWTFTLGAGQRYNVADFHSFTTSPGCRVNFADVFPSDYWFDSVSYLACNGIVSGYADNTFRPNYNTTRGQLSKMVVLAEGWQINTGGGPHFSDVPPTDPFYAYIETAYNRGIISGYSNGTFRPGSNVTRGQLSKIIVLAEGWSINTSGGPHFSDVPPSDPFYGYIETAFNKGIISGYSNGTFRPGNNATRGQISKILYNAIMTP